MLRPTRLLPVALVALASAACIHGRKHDLPPDGPRSIAYGYQTGIAGPARMVVRTAEEWHAVWVRHNSRTLPTPPVPKIDFTREMVLGVALGQRPTAGFGVRIVEVRHEGGQLRVDARETRPPTGAIVPQVISQPYEFVKVPRFDGEVVFEVR